MPWICVLIKHFVNTFNSQWFSFIIKIIPTILIQFILFLYSKHCLCVIFAVSECLLSLFYVVLLCIFDAIALVYKRVTRYWPIIALQYYTSNYKFFSLFFLIQGIIARLSNVLSFKPTEYSMVFELFKLRALMNHLNLSIQILDVRYHDWSLTSMDISAMPYDNIRFGFFTLPIFKACNTVIMEIKKKKIYNFEVVKLNVQRY